LYVVSVVCCQEVSATSWSLVQRSPTDCGASVCDLETSRICTPYIYDISRVKLRAHYFYIVDGSTKCSVVWQQSKVLTTVAFSWKQWKLLQCDNYVYVTNTKRTVAFPWQ
jgi:hypothetical protein